MKLLILIAMGVIGVIGTIEYSHAQTILTLNPLPNTPEAQGTQDNRVNLATDSKTPLPDDPPDFEPFPYWYFNVRTNYTIMLGNTTSTNNIGHVFIPGPYPNVTKNPSIPGPTNNIQYCNTSPDDIKHILIWSDGNSDNVTNLKIPSNIKEQTPETTIAGGMNFEAPHNNERYPCPVDFEAPSKYPLIMDKELIWTFYNQSDNKAYHFSPRENIMEAQPIPLCTTETINATTLTLKGDTKMCYGKHESNMVIITKKLTGFYGASESITTPKKQFDLNSNIADDPDYLALLKKLYLPAI